MEGSYQALARQAQAKALEVRRKFNVEPKSPVCIYDICEKLGDAYRNKDILVQFAPLSGLEYAVTIKESASRQLR